MMMAFVPASLMMKTLMGIAAKNLTASVRSR
jgi:hypothetical protein